MVQKSLQQMLTSERAEIYFYVYITSVAVNVYIHIPRVVRWSPSPEYTCIYSRGGGTFAQELWLLPRACQQVYFNEIQRCSNEALVEEQVEPHMHTCGFGEVATSPQTGETCVIASRLWPPISRAKVARGPLLALASWKRLSLGLPPKSAQVNRGGCFTDMHADASCMHVGAI